MSSNVIQIHRHKLRRRRRRRRQRQQRELQQHSRLFFLLLLAVATSSALAGYQHGARYQHRVYSRKSSRSLARHGGKKYDIKNRDGDDSVSRNRQRRRRRKTTTTTTTTTTTPASEQLYGFFSTEATHPSSSISTTAVTEEWESVTENTGNVAVVENRDRSGRPRPLAIHPHFVDTSSLDARELEYLRDHILSPAVAAWSSALSVLPRSPPFQQEEEEEDFLVINRDQLYDGITCGPGKDSGYPSPIVPKEHLTVGVEGADLLLYVTATIIDEDGDDGIEGIWKEGKEENWGIAFKEEKERIHEKDTIPPGDRRRGQASLEDESDVVPFGEEDITVENEEKLSDPTSFIHKPRTFSLGRETLKPQGVTPAMDSGIGMDLSIEEQQQQEQQQKKNGTGTTMNDSIQVSLVCPTPDHVASATYCATDHNDRPIAGTLHFCIRRGKKRYSKRSSFSYSQDSVGDCSGNDCDSLGDVNHDHNVTLSHDERWSHDTESFFHPSNRAHAVTSAVHEIGHVLGMNVQAMAHFRDRRTGDPLTERDEDGDVVEQEVECTGPAESELDDESTMAADFDANYKRDGVTTQRPKQIARRKEMMVLPSEKVLKFADVRGGVRVAMVVTNNVQLYTRNQFDCQELLGAELESGLGSWTPPPTDYLTSSTDISLDTSLSPNPSYDSDDEESSLDSCIGDHWERRLFKTDVLNPVVSVFPSPQQAYKSISLLTLAFMMDSGWYQVNITAGSLVDGWGRGRGCDFVNEPCVDPETGKVGAGNEAFFCNDPMRSQHEDEDGESWGASGDDSKYRYALREIQGCTDDLSRKAVCSLQDLSESPEDDAYGTETGSSSSRYNSRTSSSLDDIVGRRGSHPSVPPQYQYFRETYGSSYGGGDPDLDYCPTFEGFYNGLCTDAANDEALRVHEMEEFGIINSRCIPAVIGRSETGMCLPTACVIADRSLRIKVDGIWRECRYGGQKIMDWWDHSQYIVCPDPWRTCTAFFCPHNCLGTHGGICDYKTGLCMCNSLNAEGVQEEIATNGHYGQTGASTGTHSTEGLPTLVNKDGTCISYPDNFTTTQFYSVERLTTSLSSFYVSNSTILVDDATTTLGESIHRFFALMNERRAALFIVFCALVVFSLGFTTYKAVDKRYRILRSASGIEMLERPVSGPDVPPSPSADDDIRHEDPRRQLRSAIYLQFLTAARWKLDHFRQRARIRRGGVRLSRAARQQFAEERKYNMANSTRTERNIGDRDAGGGEEGRFRRENIYSNRYLGDTPDTLISMCSTVVSNLSENTSEEDDEWTEASGKTQGHRV